MTKRGPQRGFGSGVALANAEKAWDPVPEWVRVLAQACDRPGASQGAVAKRIGYSASAVSSVLNNKYAGDIGRVEQAVRGALMSETVMCPVCDEITRDVCLSHQRKAKSFKPTSAMRTQLYHACRRTCPHSMIREGHDAE